jgi:hypothetical protein
MRTTWAPSSRPFAPDTRRPDAVGHMWGCQLSLTTPRSRRSPGIRRAKPEPSSRGDARWCGRIFEHGVQSEGARLRACHGPDAHGRRNSRASQGSTRNMSQAAGLTKATCNVAIMHGVAQNCAAGDVGGGGIPEAQP